MNAGQGAVEVVIVIPARVSTVFGFFTDPVLYRRWMGDTAELDPRPGGLYRVSMATGQVAEGRFLVVEPPSRVSYSWGWVGDATVPPGSSTVEVTLEPDGEGTLLRLVHSGLPGPSRDVHRDGWRHFLARLAEASAGNDRTGQVLGPDTGPQPT